MILNSSANKKNVIILQIYLIIPVAHSRINLQGYRLAAAPQA